MIAFRIADSRHPIYDGTGAMLSGGSWNSAGFRAIYAAETYAGAMLEVLVHANLSVPPKHHQLVQIAIPDTVKIETISADKLTGWDAEDVAVARAFGDGWLREGRTAVLRVPGVVTAGREFNVLINPMHAQAKLIETTVPAAIRWDVRLFAAGSKRS